VLVERWQHTALCISIRSSSEGCLEEEDTTTQEVMTVTGMMITGTTIDHTKMIITGTTIKEMNATMDAQPTLIVNGVSVNVIMDIQRNGEDVKVTGEGFLKHRFNNIDQLPLIHLSHVLPPQTAFQWT